ncbi:MAG: lysophospholipid acyltransferase family protein [Saprospiraceae bacterium]
MQGWIRVIWRFFYFAFATIIHIAGFIIMMLLGMPKKNAGARLRRRWLSHVPDMMGMRMEMKGVPYEGTCLYVANHIGYIDPFVILVHVEANVVAKAEILKWPLVGLGGYMAGTIFVNREDKSSRLETVVAVQSALEEGTSILIFPEGTTSGGPGTLPFRPRSFQAAFLAGVPVQPIAIMYHSPLVAFIGKHTFIPHFFRLFRLKYITGRVLFGPLLKGEDTCESSKQWIDQILTQKTNQPT